MGGVRYLHLVFHSDLRKVDQIFGGGEDHSILDKETVLQSEVLLLLLMGFAWLIYIGLGLCIYQFRVLLGDSSWITRQ